MHRLIDWQLYLFIKWIDLFFPKLHQVTHETDTNYKVICQPFVYLCVLAKMLILRT